MWKNNKCHMTGWHRVVAETFIENPNNLPVVNHKDGNKQNYIASNLEWCTQQQNIQHAYKTSLSHIHCEKKVNQYDLNGNYIKTWKSRTDAARTLKINISTICAVCNGRVKTAGGYIWKNCEISNDYRKPIEK